MSMLIGKPNQSRQQRELDEANLALRGRRVAETAKEVVRDNITTVAISQATPLSEEEAFAERVLTEQLEEAMELLATEAREALAANPNDEAAQHQLLQYQQWRRTKDQPSRLVIAKKRQTRSNRIFGVWQRTRDYGWLIKVSGTAVVGDVVEVKKKGGATTPMRLTNEIAPRYFKGVEA